MPNINSGSTAQQMYDVCNEVREVFSLGWDNFVAYPSDNTNSIIGQCDSFLHEIQSVQGDQKIFVVGFPCHLAHLDMFIKKRPIFVEMLQLLLLSKNYHLNAYEHC